MLILKSDLMQQSNQVGVRFLLAEVDAGLTFLNVAASSAMPGSRERNLKTARELYKTVLRLRFNVQPAPEEKQELQNKLAELRTGLIEAGCSPDGEQPSPQKRPSAVESR